MNFGSHADAVAFVKATRANEALRWQDKSSSTVKTIRSRLDKAPAERQLGRVMGSVRAKVKYHLVQRGGHK